MKPPPPPEPGVFAMLRRFALGAVLLVVLSGAAAATAGFMEVRDITSAFNLSKPLDVGDEITEAEAGDPQTILLLGSDRRISADPLAGGARSDTMMLVRLNPQADAVTVMNIPRDLAVDIPGHGRDKINAAYDEGGPRLTLKTVKQLLGIDINHVINVNFGGFEDIVDSINCIYVDVDRRYYNQDPSYDLIDIKPGYQKLCGEDALDFARFRKDDTDLVRAARQQEVLRQAKAQVSTSELFDNRRKLLRIFGSYAQADRGLRKRSQVIRLLKLALFSARKPVAQVEFPAIIPNDPRDTYLRYRESELEEAVDAFMQGEASDSSNPQLQPTPAERRERRRRAKRRRAGGDAGLEDAQVAGEDQVVAVAGQLPFPVLFPKMRPRGSLYIETPRVYRIRARGNSYGAYRMVLKKEGIGEYFGVQGTSWKEPPILSEPHEDDRIAGKRMSVYYDGRRIRMIAYRTPQAVYWISNTLTESISNKQMIGMARSLTRLG